MHHWTHLEVGLYILVALFMLYKPPQMSAGLGGFIERHFGDTVGFYILHLGIILVVIGGVYPQVGGVTQTGNSLILAGMVALKLTKTPGDNGTTTSQTTTTSSTVSPTPPRVTDTQQAAREHLGLTKP